MKHTTVRRPAAHLPPHRRRHVFAGWLAACAIVAAAAPALAAGAKASPGRALAERQGCLGCHAVDAQLVGPAFQAVAERYRDQAAAETEMVQHIRAGGTGRWGAMAMPPQAQLSETDARRLAKWILSGAK